MHSYMEVYKPVEKRQNLEKILQEHVIGEVTHSQCVCVCGGGGGSMIVIHSHNFLYIADKPHFWSFSQQFLRFCGAIHKIS